MKDIDLDLSWDNLNFGGQLLLTGCIIGCLGLMIGVLATLFILVIWLANTLLY